MHPKYLALRAYFNSVEVPRRMLRPRPTANTLKFIDVRRERLRKKYKLAQRLKAQVRRDEITRRQALRRMIKAGY